METMIKKIVKKGILFSLGVFHRILGTKNIIIFKGYDDLDGNAYSLYEYLLNREEKNKYKYVWLVSDYRKYHSNETTDYISRTKPLLKNVYYRACGKFLFWDHGYVDGFEYVEKVVYLGHGNPAMKNTSTMIKICNTPTDVALTTSEGSRKHTSEMINISQNKLFVCGLPRNDVIFNERKYWKDVIDRKDCKIVLWMPTFRKARDGVRNDSNQQYLYGLPLMHTMSDIDELNEKLRNLHILLIIKPHPFAEDTEMSQNNISNIFFLTREEVVKRGINVYCFFNDTNALITDYSSVVFDYMLADKPIGYIIDDIEEYKLGFPFENILDYMPGNHIRNKDDLYSFFESIARNEDQYRTERQKISRWANQYPDGHNCERITKIFDI